MRTHQGEEQVLHPQLDATAMPKRLRSGESPRLIHQTVKRHMIPQEHSKRDTSLFPYCYIVKIQRLCQAQLNITSNHVLQHKSSIL